MLISAHAGYPRLLDSGADFIEIDVRRDAAGEIIDSHDEPRRGANHATFDQIIDAVVRRNIGLHLDMKEPGYEVELVSRALARMPPEKLVATPDFQESVRVIKQGFPQIRVSPIDFIALDQQEATEERLSHIKLPIWVWTVDNKNLMRRFFQDPKIEAIITNRPDRALRLRKGRS